MEEHWGEVRAVGEVVVREAYPEELEDFAAAAEWFRTASPAARRPKPPVGMGVEFASIVPIVLSAVSLLATAVATAAGEELTRATREKLAAAFGRRRSLDPPPAPLTPEQEREVFRLIRSRAAGPLDDEEARRLAEAVIGALRLRGPDES